MKEATIKNFRESLKRNIVIYKTSLIDYDATVRNIVSEGYSFVKHNEAVKYVPSIGERIYCIYDKSCILSYAVYALTGHSVIVEGFRNKEESAWEWYLSDFGEKWFTDVEQAKKALWKLYNNQTDKYKLVETRPGDFEIFMKR